MLLLVDVYHHIDKRETYFRKLGEALKPSGRVAIIDFTPEAAMGPPKASRVAASRVKTELKAAGYDLVQEHTFLSNQYFLVFAPARR